MTHIKGILFDLGGVVLDIDPQRTIQALVKLGYANAENEISKSHHKGPFIQFEEGVITEQEFVSAIQAKLPKAVDNQLILEAWGQMFVGLPKERIELILKLKEQFTVMVLSNTNSFHIREFYAMGSHLTNMNDLFHHKFFSFEQKCSKPTELIYDVITSYSIHYTKLYEGNKKKTNLSSSFIYLQDKIYFFVNRSIWLS